MLKLVDLASEFCNSGSFEFGTGQSQLDAKEGLLQRGSFDCSYKEGLES